MATASTRKKNRTRRRAAAPAAKVRRGVIDERTRKMLEAKATGRGLGALRARKMLRADAVARAREEAAGSAEQWRRPLPLTARGFDGDGGGADEIVGSMVEARATTDQVQGFYPWAIGAGAPIVGVPVGTHLMTGDPVHFDATKWMVNGYISAPIVLVLALNGFGKSSLIRRMQTGAIAQGRTSLVLGDCKPDFRDQTERMGGQVVQLGHGLGHLNPLDVGALGRVVPRIVDGAEEAAAYVGAGADEVRAGLAGHFMPEWIGAFAGASRDEREAIVESLRARAREVRLDVQMRQQMMIGSLVQLVRKGPVSDFEETMIASAIRMLYAREEFDEEHPPLLGDLYEVLKTGAPELMEDAGIDVADNAGGADAEAAEAEALAAYKREVQPLRRSLRALIQGEFGEIFNGHTSTRLTLSAPAICVDVSKIPHSEVSPLRAAVLLTCWSDGFGAVEAAHVLADAGMGPKRTFQVIMDELWQVLQASPAMVSKVNQLSRLNRGLATEMIMITHSIVDFDAFDSVATRNEAVGLVERARVKVLGALPAKEVGRLREVIELSAVEEDLLTSWSAPQSLTGEGVRPGEKPPPAPGTGNFLIKVGERGPGIPFHLSFTPSEVSSGVHNTNKRYDGTETLAVAGAGEMQ